jgi:hypothetical protein
VKCIHAEPEGDWPLGPSSERSNQRMGESAGLTSRRVSVNYVPGPSCATPRSFAGGSVRDKATLILSDAPGAVLPRMWRLFMDSRYSPSTGMDRSDLVGGCHPAVKP